ncbi:MAG: Rv1678 family membrane protein [Acidimicrobiales bacterium]
MTGPGGRSMSRYQRAQLVVALVALAFGLVGLLMARDLGFTARRGATIGPSDLELATLTLNPLGALASSALAALGAAGAWLRRRRFVTAAGVGFLVLAALVLVQWGGSANWTGGRGSNFSLWLGVGVSLLALASADRAAVASTR